MPIQRLDIQGLRSLRNAALCDCHRINILSGANGSGKTSILEAIYLLGMGRSFRSAKLDSLISYGMSGCTVYAELQDQEGDYQSIGVSKLRAGRHSFRVNRAAADTAELAKILPLLIINTDSFGLIDGGSRPRRQFIDWGVFHVKPTFIELWRRAQRSLIQRNSLLRHRRRTSGLGPHDRIKLVDIDTEIAGWENELVQSSEPLDNLRGEYIEGLKPYFYQILRRLVDLPNLTIAYQRGWSQDMSLLASLRVGRGRDYGLGYTSIGPHRANLDIRVEGLPAADILSRGQQKLVVSSLKLAQGCYLTDSLGTSPIYLIDDLPAELDQVRRVEFCKLLDEMGCQVFITSTEANLIDTGWWKKEDIRWFHVEQGVINGQ